MDDLKDTDKDLFLTVRNTLTLAWNFISPFDFDFKLKSNRLLYEIGTD